MVKPIISWVTESLKPYRDIQKQLEPMLQRSQILNGHIKQLQKHLDDIFNLKHQVSNFQYPEYFTQFKNIGEIIRKNLQETPHALVLLSKYGWYLNLECHPGLAGKLGKLIERDRIVEVDSYLTTYYTENLERIIDDLSTKYPDREPMFKDIHSSHNNKLYYTCIPCLLTQVDGICFDETTKKFFIKDKNNNWLPEIASLFTGVSGSVADAFLTPVFNSTPIHAHQNKLGEFPVQLNRHLIMHGIDKTYGTELNSLKCLSLLSYLSDMLSLLPDR